MHRMERHKSATSSVEQKEAEWKVISIESMSWILGETEVVKAHTIRKSQERRKTTYQTKSGKKTTENDINRLPKQINDTHTHTRGFKHSK